MCMFAIVSLFAVTAHTCAFGIDAVTARTLAAVGLFSYVSTSLLSVSFHTYPRLFYQSLFIRISISLVCLSPYISTSLLSVSFRIHIQRSFLNSFVRTSASLSAAH